MRKNFFYIAQYFTPEPYLKDLEFIKSIKEKGWEPIVITSFPNYPKGKIYDGYKNRLVSVEEMQGIKVIRVLTFADHSLSTFKRILNYLVFGLFASLALLKYGKSKSFYYILQSSPFVLFCAYTIRIFKLKSKILLDIQDVFPENIRVSGYIKQQWKINFLNFFLNNFYYKTFDLFVTVSESFKEIIIKKGYSAERILTLYNWSMVERKVEEKPKNFRFSTNGFNIVYAGNIGVHQGLSKLSDSINAITEKNPNIFFHFFGDGTDYEPLKNNHLRNKNILFHGRVPKEEISNYMQAADCLFLHLIKDKIYESIIPSKLQAYIEIGKPILAGIEGESRAFVFENNLGEVFEPENKTDFINACIKISHFSSDMMMEIKQRSLTLYNDEFSRKAGIEKIDKFIKKFI